MVEAARVELASENPITQFSPSAVNGFKFPSADSH